MKNKKHIKDYEKLIEDVKTKEYFTSINLNNRINCYVCSCKHITKTIDIDAGCIPMFHTCEKCGDTARSSFFKDLDVSKKPTQEWYRPDLKEFLNLCSNEKEHVLKGGLICRKIHENN